MASRYSIELWSPAGVLLADLNGRAASRRLTVTRNEADDIQWRVYLRDIEDYARSAGTTASQLLQPGITEVRVKRGSKYVAGGQILYIEPVLNANEAYVDIRATGFLNLFKDRYVASQTFSSVERTTIATTLITQTQAVDAYSNFGVTIGAQATIGAYSLTIQNQAIKDVLQALTENVLAFDMEFTPDKVFKTYAAIGSKRPELVFEYPGNIMQINAPYDATGIANRIYLLGSGVGQVQHQIQVDDVNSELNYVVREKNMILSADLDDGTLEDKGAAALAALSFPFEVPKIQVNGNVWPYVTDYQIGDYVTVKASGYSLVSQINGLYRIEMIEIQISDDDDEKVTLSLGR